MQGAEHGQPVLPAQAVDQVEDLLGVPEVQGRGRLVEQQHPRLLGQRPGQDGALLLPAGEGAQRPVGQAADLQPLHDVGDDPPVHGAGSGQQRPVRGAAEQDVVAGGHRLGQHRQLRGVGHLTGPLAARHAAGRDAVDADQARRGACRPSTQRSRVDLPEPLGPMTASQPPGSTVSRTPSSTRVRP